MLDDGFLAIKNQYVGTFKLKQEELLSAFESKDKDALLRYLHKLAGSSGGYGFTKIYQLCLETRELIENNFKQDFELISEKVKEMSSQLLHEYNKLSSM